MIRISRHLHPSKIFAGKARAYMSGALVVLYSNFKLDKAGLNRRMFKMLRIVGIPKYLLLGYLMGLFYKTLQTGSVRNIEFT